MSPQYPIFVISKGRPNACLTARALLRMGVSHHVVVEPAEADSYTAALSANKLATVHVTPENFSERGDGSVPVRNYVWQLAVSEGAARHWILDDNLAKFYRLNNNRRIYAKTPALFVAAEHFVDRFTNVALGGFQYSNFAHDREPLPPFRTNTRIYSCILVNSALPHRWRGRYNEDTDLSLRVLKDGWCTVLFNAFLCDKTGTMRMRGGNTDDLYAGDGRAKMAESLAAQHPDVVRVVSKWGRRQHHVNYRGFTTPLALVPGYTIPTAANEFGMVLRRIAGQPETLCATPR